MSDNSERQIKAAKAAADHLKRLGENKMAEDVRRLARSNAALVQTCSRLYADNVALRERDARPS